MGSIRVSIVCYFVHVILYYIHRLTIWKQGKCHRFLSSFAQQVAKRQIDNDNNNVDDDDYYCCCHIMLFLFSDGTKLLPIHCSIQCHISSTSR